MSDLFQKTLLLVESGEILISEHGYDELANDEIPVRDVLASVNDGIPIEEYPLYVKGPCVLVLQIVNQNEPIHVLWGMPKDKTSPAVVITAYRPSINIWHSDFIRRKK